MFTTLAINLPNVPGAPVEYLLFAAFAAAAIIGGIAVITAKDPFVSALSLIFNFVSLGMLYLLLESSFVAVAQILVYAGAVVVLFLFVIAYLGDRRELLSATVSMPVLRPLGIGVAVLVGLGLAGLGIATKYPHAARLVKSPAGFSFGSTQAIGEMFLTKYTWVFEVTSLVLLVAAIGGITLGLTGRARHERMRKIMHTRSADQQRRWYDERSRAGTLVGGAHVTDAQRAATPVAAGAGAGTMAGAAPAGDDDEEGTS